ncbi:GNAT family N-acetyltransferase [Pseudonocardia acidicola]|uniref:GNAT family N-acetyltransferase n=1 Tax=Pseudonocardia acidicola TaxID=2724939 RepID=A0ABX1SDI6_9PSEU|nr:GNAT family N-acetyltransferase [Pseudonocardia acidicola]NMH99639.1 GNAT family N-acetyltransferase [Pseudonocardia acidicola]
MTTQLTSAQWIRETPARWDADKTRVLGGLDPALFGFGSPTDGDALGDEWWRVEDGGRVLGYGRLDDTWGDAEILVLVEPERRGSGVGAFILDHLEQEAAERHLNYIYNVVPHGHPDPEPVTTWLTAHGFAPNDVGELRKRVPGADPR